MKRAKTRRRASRAMLADLLADLCNRLDKQAWAAECIGQAAEPNPATALVGNRPMMTVVALAAQSHAKSLRDVARLAVIVRDAAAGSGGCVKAGGTA